MAHEWRVQARFARRHGVRPWTLWYWSRKTAMPPAQPTFVQVTPAPARPPLEVVLPDGVRVVGRPLNTARPAARPLGGPLPTRPSTERSLSQAARGRAPIAPMPLATGRSLVADAQSAPPASARVRQARVCYARILAPVQVRPGNQIREIPPRARRRLADGVG